MGEHPIGEQAAGLMGAVAIVPPGQPGEGRSERHDVGLGERDLGAPHRLSHLGSTVLHRRVIGRAAQDFSARRESDPAWLQ